MIVSHVTSNAWVSVYPPSSSNSSLSVKDSELIKSKLLFEPAAHGNAGLSSTHNYHRVVSIGIFFVTIDPPNCFRHGEKGGAVAIVAAGGDDDAISVRSAVQSRNSIICFEFRGPESAQGGIVREAAEMTEINNEANV